MAVLARAGGGIGLALGAALLFGLVNVAAKGATLSPLQLGGAAYLLAGLALAAFLRSAHVERRDAPRVLAMALLGGALAPLALFAGLERTSATHASLLLTLEMVFTAILARAFLRERVTGRAALALVLLFSGALVVGASAVAPRDADDPATLAGDALVVLAALGWAADNAVSADLAKRHKPHHLIALKGLIGGGAALLAAALLVRAPVDVTLENVRAVAYIGLLGIGASTVLFYHALQRVGATRTASVFLPTTALAGVGGAAILLGEPLRWLHVASAALAVAGVILMTTEPPGPASPE